MLPKPVVDAVLASGEVYEVGGSVRDCLIAELRGETVSAFDEDYVVRGFDYDRLCELLRRFGRADVVGRSFGVVKFTPRGSNRAVDVALPRTELSTGRGHRDFAVEADPNLPIEDDLRRRDFTINAIARDLRDGRLVDPTDGQSDIRDGVVRMVFGEAFRDDPLRILRGAVLAARLGFEVEPATESAMREASKLVGTVAPERVLYEFSKLWTRAERPSSALRIMQSTGTLFTILPELEATVGVDQPGGHHAYDVFEHTLRTVDAAPADESVRWAALLHDAAKPQTKAEVDGGSTYYGHEIEGERIARDVLSRLRASGELVETTAVLIRHHMFNVPETDRGVRRLIRKVGVDRVFALLDLRRADIVAQAPRRDPSEVDELQSRIEAELDREVPLSVADLAINGDDVMGCFDVPESPIVGEVLSHLLEYVLDDPKRNTREELMARAREYMSGGKA
jgi:tRNA nucleotidyltransferase (CCA-adding enzyme)